MNEFDKRVTEAWTIEKTKAKPRDPEYEAYSHIIDQVLTDLYKTMPQDVVDDMVYRGQCYTSISIGTAMQIQRRVILRLMPPAR